jgi:hypothetical protein
MKFSEMLPHDRSRKLAHRAVAKALAEGTLIRPRICENCLNPGPEASDGRATIHGHHYKGYEFPLDVKWLCSKCHCKEDPRPSKEASGMAKLDREAVSLIRAKYKPSPIKGGRRKPSPTCCHALAIEFGVSKSTIERVVRNLAWVDEVSV